MKTESVSVPPYDWWRTMAVIWSNNLFDKCWK